jgi:thymidine kinase
MYYKKPNQTIIEDILGCEFVRSAQVEKAEFQNILKTVVGDDLNYQVITTVNDKIKEIIDANKNDTETTVIDKLRLKNLLQEVGVDNEKLLALDTVYDTAIGKTPMIASNIVDSRTVVATPEVTVNVSKEGIDKVRTSNINGRKCIIIDVEENSVEINGISTKM